MIETMRGVFEPVRAILVYFFRSIVRKQLISYECFLEESV